MITYIKSNVFTFSKILCLYRNLIKKNKKVKQLINNVINNENLTDEIIKEEIINNSISKDNFFKKIINKEKNIKSLEKVVTAVMKICKKKEIIPKKRIHKTNKFN